MSQDQISKNQRKGMRHEQEANNILRVVYRHSSRVTDAWSPKGTTDVFNCADLIAVREGWPTKFVQVKSNSRPGEIQSWPASFVDNEYTQFEWWSRIDYQGWEIYSFIPGEKPGAKNADMEKVLELDTSLELAECRDAYAQYLNERWGLTKEENE